MSSMEIRGEEEGGEEERRERSRRRGGGGRKKRRKQPPLPVIPASATVCMWIFRFAVGRPPTPFTGAAPSSLPPTWCCCQFPLFPNVSAFGPPPQG